MYYSVSMEAWHGAWHWNLHEHVDELHVGNTSLMRGMSDAFCAWLPFFLHILKLVFLDLWSWHFIHGFAGDSIRIPNQKWEILDVQNKRGGTCPLSWFGFLLQEQVLMFSLWSMTGILTPLSPLVFWLLLYVWSYLPTGVRWQRQKQCGCHAASFNRIIYVLFQVLR